MTDENKELVTGLKRRYAHLQDVNADPAKLAELRHQLRMAGHPVNDDLDGVEEEKPGVNPADAERDAKHVAPKERSAKPHSTADAPSKAESDDKPKRTAAKSEPKKPEDK